jgi:hypothetical protein
MIVGINSGMGGDHAISPDLDIIARQTGVRADVCIFTDFNFTASVGFNINTAIDMRPIVQANLTVLAVTPDANIAM